MIRSDESTVLMPAVRPKAERQLGHALRLLAEIRRIARANYRGDGYAIALGAIAGLLSYVDDPEHLNAAADCAERTAL